MSPERWRQIEELYQAALERDPGRRAEFLAEACQQDEELRREVEAMLAQEGDSDGVLAPGTLVGAYRIEATLGQGGMGVVYRALDTKLNRRVAVKFLSNEIADATARRRFQREAQMASSLNHPHILTVHDAGEWGGRQYLVTEFVDGGTLTDWARAEKRPWRQIVELLTGVADGLAAAHAAGILHRDIKPANILVAKNGYAKLADFGLAKLEERIGPSDPTRTLAEDTRPGMIRGTVPYMSPEQALGGALDARSDIFSFGVVLYEMLAGKRPFTGATDLVVLQNIIHGTAAPLGEELPAGLRIAVEKSLEKEPAERYQSMREMVVDLRRLTRQSGDTAAPAAARKRPGWKKRAFAAALPLVLLVAGFFAWRAWREPDSTEPLRAVPLTTLPGVHRYPSFSPDGNQMAFTWTGPKQDNPDIYVQMIGSAGSPLRLTTDPSNDYSPVWSPDGRWIAFLRRQSEARKSELRLIPPLGGPERKLAEVRPQEDLLRPVSVAWCPDSDCLLVTDSPGEGKPDALFVVSLETGEKRPLTYPQPPAMGDTNPAVSPDGRWLVFRRNASGPFSGELYRLPLGKGPASGASAAPAGLIAVGEPQRLTPAALDAEYPTWMPDSKEILFSARGSLWRLVVTGENPGESTPARLPFVGEDGQMPVVSRPQPGRPPRLVYVRIFRDWNIWRVETSAPGPTASSPPVVSISSTRQDADAQISPDGHRVAFYSDRSGEGEIWLADLDGSNAVQLTSMRRVHGAGAPRWSPNGERITFHSIRDGQGEVYVIPAAGGKPRNLTSHPATDGYPSFSRDGKLIYFKSNRTGENQIWRIPVSGGEAVQVTHNIGDVALESPDGAYLYYVQTFDRPSPLWRLPASGGAPVKVLEGVVLGNFVVREGGVYYIDWPSGQGGVYYLDKPSGETRLQYFDFATRRSTTVARNLGNVGPFLTASPDGRTILYTRLDSAVDDLMLVENFR